MSAVEAVAVVLAALAGGLAAVAAREAVLASPAVLRWLTSTLEPLRRAGREGYAPTELERRRLAVLGGMAELGPDGPEYHREIGSLARGLGVEPVIGVGELARDYAPDEWAGDPSAAVEIVDALIGDGDVVLVKGSRSVGLERFTDELIGRRGGA